MADRKAGTRAPIAITELLAAIGDDNILVQFLDRCTERADMSRGITKITFGTPQPLTPEGTERLGLVVWLDREAVKRVVAAKKAEAAP